MEPIKVRIPEVFAPLMKEKIRNKFFYGGRAGGKSYAFADSLLLLGRERKLFIACLREIQESIKDSVYKLLCDRINFYGMNDYKITAGGIRNKVTGTRFVFKGLRDQDSRKIKLLEGVDIAWIEEAQAISKASWEILEPTIRKDGSEIWISMNREQEDDPLWLLVGAAPDEQTLVRRKCCSGRGGRSSLGAGDAESEPAGAGFVAAETVAQLARTAPVSGNGG